MLFATAVAGSAEMRNAPSNAAASPRRISTWLLAITLLGLVLRVIALGHRSFWLDEIASVVIAGLPRDAFWHHVWTSEGNMALYYVLLRPWLHLGVGETAVRLLSVIPGALSIPALYALGNRLFGETTGLLASLLLAVNACAVTTSQEARGYSLLILGVIGSTYLFVRLVEGPDYSRAVAYGIAAGLTCYCHYFGLLVPAAQAISLAFLPRERRPWRQLLAAFSVLALLAAPVLWMIHTQDVGHLAWVSPPSLLELYRLGAYLSAGTGKVIGGILLAVDLVVLALFLRRFRRAGNQRQPMTLWRNTLVASLLVSPILIALAASVVHPVFHHRFLVIGLPAWVLMLAAGVRTIQTTSRRVAVIAIIAALSLGSVISSYGRVKEDWRGVARYLLRETTPQDAVLYYQADGAFAAESYRTMLQGATGARPQAVIVGSANNWERQLNYPSRIWLVLYRAKPDEAVPQAVVQRLREDGFAEEHRRSFRAVTVIDYRAGR